MCQSQRAPSTKVHDFSTNHDFQTGDRIASLHAAQIKQSEEQLLTARSTEVHHDEQRIIGIIVLTTLLSTLLRVAIAAWRSRAAMAAGEAS